MYETTIDTFQTTSVTIFPFPRLIKEEEEKRRQFVVVECERVMLQKEMLIRLQPLGLDRNHDRYWLFNNTTPGLYVEKGWVDHHSTYCTQVSGRNCPNTDKTKDNMYLSYNTHINANWNAEMGNQLYALILM